MECHVCGGKEFNINVGKQMCAECGTENEKYVEVAAAEETIGCNANRHRIVHVSEQVIDAASASKLATGTSAYSKWTTYEAYTFVLQDWSLALVKLGASASLPELVLRMWAGYLNKIEVAFLETKIRNNQSVPKTPKVGLLRNKRDVILLHQKAPFVRKSFLTGSSQKIKEKKNRKLKRIVRKTMKQKTLSSVKVHGRHAKSLVQNLSIALLASDPNANNTQSQSSPSSPSSGSSGCSSASTASHMSTDPEEILRNFKPQPVLRSCVVLRWLNNNEHIYDTMETSAQDRSQNDEPAEERASFSSVEELPRSVQVPDQLLAAAASLPKRNTTHYVPINTTNKWAANEAMSLFGSVRSETFGESLKRKNDNDPNGKSHDDAPLEKVQKTSHGETTNASVGDQDRSIIDVIREKSTSIQKLKDDLHELFQKKTPLKSAKRGRLRRNRFVSRRDMHEYKYFEPYTPTFAKLVALLYIACRVNGEEMLLLDLLNWCNSNHLPYQAAPYLLEDSMIDLTRLDLYQLRQCKSVPWHGHVYRLVIKLSVLLDAQLLPLPRSDVVTSRLLHILCLPKSLAPSVSALVQRWPIDQLESPYKFEVHSPETFVAAIIVLLLKMSWGLDGVQEDKLSCQVLRINAELRRHGSKHRLFCWRTWHRHINRLLWFNETVDLSGPRHPFRRPPLNHSMDLSSLVHSFWSEGLWRRSRSTAKREDSLAPLFHQLLRTNDQSITKLLNEERLFNVTYHHLTGVAQQYKHCWLNDVRADKDDMKQVADEICRTSFECHQFDFLSNVKPVQAALASSGSELRVQVKSMSNEILKWSQLSWVQNSFSTRRMKKKKNISNETFCDIDENPPSSSNDISSENENSEVAYDYPDDIPDDYNDICDEDNGVEDLDPSDDEEDLELRSNEIHLVNPLEHFWHAPSAIMGSAPDGIRHARSAIRSSAPQSFWWLLEVVAFVCREKPENLLSKVVMLEKLI
ncbi:uncharacterized protein LOC108664874 [Hyalella azteca]|uniref:Uncharacterized protein LOC108664874 n=1 Tax=Hyalella azteca TaxID=294128 RepID=A0A8B7N0M9_HYAAZ|nr:uncharacterized protein LOC108664874 [Hyalella azteca]